MPQHDITDFEHFPYMEAHKMEVEDFVRSKNKNVKFFQVDSDKIILEENL